MVRKTTTLLLGVACGALLACGDAPTGTPDAGARLAPHDMELRAAAADLTLEHGGAGPVAFIDGVNAELASQGAGLALDRMELMVTEAGADRMPLVFAADRSLRLSSRWVPGDVRRNASGNVITQGSFVPFMVANGAIPTEGIVNATFATWNGVRCSNLDIVETDFSSGIFPSIIFALDGFTNDFVAADISTVGWLPGFIFDIFLDDPDDPDDMPSQFVLGVTFTFIFGSFLPDGTFVPSDVDNNGRTDTALKEVWYNDAFTWTATGVGGIDIETVALHENGHALELGHFGRIAINPAGKVQISPRAVMNAIFLGPFRDPAGTDNGAYCGNFASWPRS